MLDVVTWIRAKKPYAYATCHDYIRQIERCRTLFNVNDLDQISADLDAFRNRFPRAGAHPEDFKTWNSYNSWRKKVTSCLKRFHGLMKEHIEINDDWYQLIRASTGLVGIGTGITPQRLIPIKVLADEARKIGYQPKDLTLEILDQLSEPLTPAQRKAVRTAITNLETFRCQSDAIDALLVSGPLPRPTAVRRRANPPLPPDLSAEITNWIEDYCAGEFDPIFEEYDGAKSEATKDCHRAALRKYASTALRLAPGMSAAPLASLMTEQIFYSVLRDWFQETDAARKVSNRTTYRYVSILRTLAAHHGLDNDFMDTSRRTNRNLKAGKQVGQEMTPGVKMFCARLLASRHQEMIFQSLHLRFRDRADALIRGTETVPFTEYRIVQCGVCAVFAALELWGVPLRLGNATGLRHLGTEPSLILPAGPRQKIQIRIAGHDVKNGKNIRAFLAGGRERASEVVNWYLKEIRPRIPWADRSDYLIPGYESRQISQTSLRNWLWTHSRDLGLPMKPHNFRHGLASLYLKYHPGEYNQAATLLGDKPETIRRYYAWIDNEAELAEVQRKVARMGGLST